MSTPETATEIDKARGPYKVSRISAAAAAAALRDEEGWVERTVAECNENRARAEGELEERGFAPLPSHTNFMFFRAPSGDAVADANGIREHGVALRPFPGTYPGGLDGLRCSVGPWPMMESFLEALDRHVASLEETPAVEAGR